MNEQLLSQLAPALPWASVQFRQGRITPALVKEIGQTAVRLNPELLSFNVPDHGSYEAVLDKALCGLFDHGLELREEEDSFSVSCPVDFGLESGEFPLLADASYVKALSSMGQQDLARRVTIAICLLEGFRFDHCLDWWMESIEEMAEEEDDGEFAKAKIEDLTAIKVDGRRFGSFSRILAGDKGNAFLIRFQREIEEWIPAPFTHEEAWKKWIIEALWWKENCSGILNDMPPNEDNDGLAWHDLVGFGWDNDTFWEEYDGMVNASYEGGGIAAPSQLEVTPENIIFLKEKSAQYQKAFVGLCGLVQGFNKIKETTSLSV